jgi:hypothetical protein
MTMDWNPRLQTEPTEWTPAARRAPTLGDQFDQITSGAQALRGQSASMVEQSKRLAAAIRDVAAAVDNLRIEERVRSLRQVAIRITMGERGL